MDTIEHHKKALHAAQAEIDRCKELNDELMVKARRLEAEIFVRRKMEAPIYKHVGLWERDTLREALLHNIPMGSNGKLDEEKLSDAIDERLSNYLRQVRQRSMIGQVSQLPLEQIEQVEQRLRGLERKRSNRRT